MNKTTTDKKPERMTVALLVLLLAAGAPVASADSPDVPNPEDLGLPALAPIGTSSATIVIRDDDGEKDTEADVDAPDGDYIQKRLDIAGGQLSGASSAKVWVYARYEGTCALQTPSHRMSVNGGAALFTYNPCLTFSSVSSWKSFDVPVAALLAGQPNYVSIDETTGTSLERNAFYGIDTDHDYGRSTITVCNVTCQWDLPGELMIYFEVTTGGSAPVGNNNEDFELGKGDWATNGLWHLTSRRGAQGTAMSMWYGQESTLNYNTGATNSGALISPTFSIPSGGATLWVQSWHQTEQGITKDKKFIDLSTNGGNSYTTLMQVGGTLSAWQDLSLSLNAFAGATNAVLRFRFDTVDSGANSYEGWFIDSIQIDPIATPTTPAEAQGGAVACGYPAGIKVTWNEPTSGTPTYYQVWRGPTPSDLTFAGTTSGFTRTFTDAPEWTTATYYYRMLAFNTAGVSQFSPAVGRVPCDAWAPGGGGPQTLLDWSATPPTLSGPHWSDLYSGLAQDATYRFKQGSTIGPWLTMPDQPTLGQTSTWTPSFTPTGYADGEHFVDMAISDRAGNHAEWGYAFRVRLDTAAPTSTCSAQTPWVNYNPTLQGCFQDMHSGFAQSARYWIGSTPGASDYKVSTPMTSQPTLGATSWYPTFQVASSALRQGSNYVTVQLSDRVGNTATYNVAEIRYDNVGDAISSLVARTQENGDLIALNTWQTDKTPRFEWTAPASSSPIVGYSHTMSTSSATTPDSTVETTGLFHDLANTPLADGTHYFKVRAKDQATNLGSVSTFTFKVDTILPCLPSVSSSTHVNEALYYAKNLLSVAWSACDTLSGVDGYSYDLVPLGTGSTLDTVKDGEETTVATTFSNLGPFAVYTFRVRAVDNAGNWGPVKSFNVRVDTILPDLDDAMPGDGSVVSPLQEFFADYSDTDNAQDFGSYLTPIDVATVKLFIDGVNIGAQYASACPPNGLACTYSVTPNGVHYKPAAPWTPGTHSVRLEFNDTAVGGSQGNQRVELWDFMVSATGGSSSNMNGPEFPADVGAWICENVVAATYITATDALGHACNGSEYVPAPAGSTVFVATALRVGADNDGDGMPATVTLEGSNILHSGGAVESYHFEAANVMVVLDSDDSDAETGPTVVSVEVTAPSQGTSESDAAFVQVDRRNGEPSVTIEAAPY